MGRPRKHSSQSKKNYTKEELHKKKKAEEGLKEFEKLDTSSPPMAIRGDTMAVTEWKRIIPLLNDLPISNLDLYSVVQYCRYVSIYVQASKNVQLHGTVIEGKQNPHYQIMLTSSKEIRALSTALGLTIDSRLKMVVPQQEKENKDPFAELEDI